MGIAGRKKIITNNDVNPINLENSTVVDGYGGNSISSYVKYIDGYNLEVDYYSFIASSNTERTMLDPNDQSQQYVLIKQLVLKTQTPLSTGNYESLTIEAVLDANLVPAMNDIVLLKMLNGIVGMFHVSEISKKTYIERTIYDITLKFLFFKKDSITYYDSLKSKVKKTYIYDKGSIATNSSPVVLESTYRERTNLRNDFSKLLDYYLTTFTHEKVISFTYDGNTYHDTNVEKLLFSIVTDRDNDRLLKIKRVDNFEGTPSILDNLLSSNEFFSTDRYYSTEAVFFDGAIESNILLSTSNINNRVVVSDTPGDTLKINGELSILIPNVFRGDTNTYIFSPEFYDELEVETLSTLEKCIVSYTNNEVIDVNTTVGVLISDVSNWNVLEQYYYIPLLLMLIQYSEMNSFDRI